MSKSNSLEADFLNHWFRGTTPSWNGNSNLYVALFTADPTESLATTNECTYTGYTRTAIARSGSSPFAAATAGSTSNADLINLATCTGGSSQVITHAAIVDTASGAIGAGMSWSLPQAITVFNGVTPFLPIGNITVTED